MHFSPAGAFSFSFIVRSEKSFVRTSLFSSSFTQRTKAELFSDPIPSIAEKTVSSSVFSAVSNSSLMPYAESSLFATSGPTSGIESANMNLSASTVMAFSTEALIFSALFSPKPSRAAISSLCSGSLKISERSCIHPRFTKRCNVISEIPSISIPSFETKRENFLSCFAGHFSFEHRRVFVPLISETLMYVFSPQTGQVSGMMSSPFFSFTSMTFGIILFALMTERIDPFPPIERRSHSDILQREALFAVVPSRATGSNTATGVIEPAAQLHSIYERGLSTASSAHLKAKPALVA